MAVSYTHLLKNRLSILGVQLDQEKLDKVYEEFLKLADKKKDINDDDILVLACLLYTSTGCLEYSRGRRNSWCSGEMLRYHEELRLRRQPAGL